jgi:hypothetical protein
MRGGESVGSLPSFAHCTPGCRALPSFVKYFLVEAPIDDESASSFAEEGAADGLEEQVAPHPFDLPEDVAMFTDEEGRLVYPKHRRVAVPDARSTAGAYVSRAALSSVNPASVGGVLGPREIGLAERPQREAEVEELRREVTEEWKDGGVPASRRQRRQPRVVVEGGDGRRLMLSDDVDLTTLLRDGARVTNAMVQELCMCTPHVRALNLAGCEEVTDAGLWAVGRDALSLRRLGLAKLPHITHVGLRSISLRCRQIEWLDLSGCVGVDDLGLRVIASGLWGLSTFHVRDCAGFTDAGLCDVAKCCRKLKDVDVSRCPRITDKSLRFLATYCGENGGLVRFAAVASRQCGDDGFRAIAAASPGLTALNLSRCDLLTGSTVAAVVEHCTGLDTLALDGCKRLSSAHLEHIVRRLPHLTQLFVSECPLVKLPAYSVLAHHGSSLVRLRAGGCEHTEDSHVRALTEQPAGRLTSLRDLDLSGSRCLTGQSLVMLVSTYSRLTSIRLNRCKGIQREFVQQLADEMPYSTLAERWFGLEALPDFEARAAAIARKVREWEMTVKLQCWWRMLIAQEKRRRLAAFRRGGWAVGRFQAIWRGCLARERTSRMKRRLQCEAGAQKIQDTWRASKLYREEMALRLAMERRRLENAASTSIQRVWRGHAGRQRVTRIRHQLAFERAEWERSELLRLEACVRIQCVMRVALARMRATRLREVQRLEEERRKFLNDNARVIQRRVKQYLSRLELLRRWEARELERRRQRASLMMQCAWRCFLARRELWRRREIALHAARHRAATLFQAVWRGARSRHFAAVVRAFAHLRAAENAGAVKIQTVWRGFGARRQFEAMLQNRGRLQQLDGAASAIQSAFRGMRGRQVAAIARAMLDAERRAKEEAEELARLVRAGGARRGRDAGAATEAELKLLKDEHDALLRQKKDILDEQRRIQQKMQSWAREAEDLRHVGLTEVDSDKITGTKQRYKAPWLRARLVEAMDGMQREIRRLEEEYEKASFQANDVGRRLRAAERVVGPMREAVVETVLLARRQQFMDYRQRRRWAAAKMQAAFRAHAIRRSVRNGFNPWAAVWDPLQGCTVYFNTITQSSRKTRPVDYEVWGGALPQQELDLQRQQASESASPVAAAEVPPEDASTSMAELYGLVPVEGEEGWFKGWDTGSQAYYYWNQTSGEYRWEPPGGSDGEAQLGMAFASAEAAGAPDGVVERSSAGTRIGSSAWVEMYDPETQLAYYFNEETGESAWSLPPSLVHASQSPPIAESMPGDAHSDAGETLGDPLPWEWREEGAVVPVMGPDGGAGNGARIPAILLDRLALADREQFEYGAERAVLVQWVREALEKEDWGAARQATEMLLLQQRKARDATRNEATAAARDKADKVVEDRKGSEALRRLEMLKEDMDAGGDVE